MKNKNIRTIATAHDPALVRSFRGHEKSINSVCFDNQMKQIVSGGCDAVVHVWNFKPQLRPYKFIGHKGRVEDVAFSHDGKTIISAGNDKQIRFWKNSVQGKCSSIKAHSGPILKISVALNDQFLISCSCDKTLKMWDLNGCFIKSYTSHTNWVRECQISPDQRILLSCSDDRTLKLWDLQSAKVLNTFSQNKDKVLTCKFSPDGTSVAGGGADGTIKMWDTRSSKLIQHYNAHQSQINRIAFHPYGFHLNSVSTQGKIKVWDLKSGRQGWTLFGHKGPIKTVAFNKSGDYFATGGQDSLLMIWKSSFDQIFSTPTRVNQKNFISKQSGSGSSIQPLWKSNKVISYESKMQSERVQRESYNQKFHPLSQAMSSSLQKLVNQLDFITRRIVHMDERLKHNQLRIQDFLSSEKMNKMLEQIELKGLGKQVSDSVWQNFNNANNIEINLQREDAFEQYRQHQVDEDMEVEEIIKPQSQQDINFQEDLKETIRMIHR